MQLRKPEKSETVANSSWKKILIAEIIQKPDNLIKAIIGFVTVVLAVVMFFGDSEKLKDKFPSLIMGVLGTIVLSELWERLVLNSLLKKDLGEQLENLKSEHLQNIENCLSTIQPTIENIHGLVDLVHLIEGEDSNQEIPASELTGKWLSFFQNQNYKQEKIDWTWEIIQVSELGRLLYLETKTDEKPMIGVARVVQGNVLLGHWVASYAKQKQGNFLWQKNLDNDLMYGIYNAPASSYARFYKWILVRLDQNKTQEEIKKLCQEGWNFLQPLEEKSNDFPALQDDDFQNVYEKLKELFPEDGTA